MSAKKYKVEFLYQLNIMVKNAWTGRIKVVAYCSDINYFDADDLVLCLYDLDDKPLVIDYDNIVFEDLELEAVDLLHIAKHQPDMSVTEYNEQAMECDCADIDTTYLDGFTCPCGNSKKDKKKASGYDDDAC